MKPVVKEHKTCKTTITAILVVTRFTSAGTQHGPLMGFEPTGKHVSWMGITIDRIGDGKIVENWVSWDMIGMLQQLGMAPDFR